jgi:ATP synthase protein I
MLPPAIFLAVATNTTREPAVPRLGKEPILAFLLTQTLLSGLLAGALMLWLGPTAGMSALLGGVVAVLPNAFLAARLLSPGSTASAMNLLRAAWVGEIGKLVGTAVLFAAVFVAVRPLSAPALFGGYIAAQIVVFCAPLMGGGWLGKEDTKANI